MRTTGRVSTALSQLGLTSIITPQGRLLPQKTTVEDHCLGESVYSLCVAVDIIMCLHVQIHTNPLRFVTQSLRADAL